MNLRSLRRLAIATLVAVGCLAGLMAPAANADTIPGNTPFSPFPASVYSDGCAFPAPAPMFDGHVLPDPAPWWFFPVNFRNACDVHDAGYDGGIVVDPANGTTLDTRTLTRAQIDARFSYDLMAACSQQIPIWAAVARSTCYGIAGSYVATVRTFGAASFDASPAVPGTQFFGTRANN
jgi:hypothetical protein